MHGLGLGLFKDIYIEERVDIVYEPVDFLYMWNYDNDNTIYKIDVSEGNFGDYEIISTEVGGVQYGNAFCVIKEDINKILVYDQSVGFKTIDDLGNIEVLGGLDEDLQLFEESDNMYIKNNKLYYTGAYDVQRVNYPSMNGLTTLLHRPVKSIRTLDDYNNEFFVVGIKNSGVYKISYVNGYEYLMTPVETSDSEIYALRCDPEEGLVFYTFWSSAGGLSRLYKVPFDSDLYELMYSHGTHIGYPHFCLEIDIYNKKVFTVNLAGNLLELDYDGNLVRTSITSFSDPASLNRPR